MVIELKDGGLFGIVILKKKPKYASKSHDNETKATKVVDRGKEYFFDIKNKKNIDQLMCGD